MRVLQAHNRYRLPGGEDTVVENERLLLEEGGHAVAQHIVFNDDVDPAGLGARIVAARDVVWNRASAAALVRAIKDFRPDVVHVHNTFAKLSPLAIRATREAGIPVVVTLHNYRLVCANGLLLRCGAPCTACVDGGRFNGILHRCYRGQLAATIAISAASPVHCLLGTYTGRGIRVIALSQFARRLFAKAGLDENVMVVKPNFAFAQPAPQAGERQNRVVFVGRLAQEKGVDLIVEAWRVARPAGWELFVVGDGPMRNDLEKRFPEVSFFGWRPASEVRELMAKSRFLVMGSRCFEGLPMVLGEAFSVGTPAIVPNIGAMAEYVDDGLSGTHFSAGSSGALAEVLARMGTLEPQAWRALSQGALQRYETTFSPSANLALLEDIYRSVINDAF